jgi:hypothetical protein
MEKKLTTSITIIIIIIIRLLSCTFIWQQQHYIKFTESKRSILYYVYYSLLFVDQKLFLFQTITSADKLSFLSRKIFIQKVCAEALHGCRVEQSYGA